MSEKKNVEMVRLHNQGKRVHLLRNGTKSEPGRAVNVPKGDAEFYVKAYPFDFILFTDLNASAEIKEDNAKLTAEKEALEAKIAEMEAAQAGDKPEAAKPKGGNAKGKNGKGK